MREAIERALNVAKLNGASYADVRLVQLEKELIEVKNGAPEQFVRKASLGLGVRVIVDGCWGFAAINRVGLESAEAAGVGR